MALGDAWHGYGRNDLMSHPTSDLHTGDVFVLPAEGDAHRIAADGSVTGVGPGSVAPGGTAWTVTARDGARFTLRSHDGQAQDPAHFVDRDVLPVLTPLDPAEVRRLRKALTQAAGWLETAQPTHTADALASIDGLNRALTPATVASILRGARPDDGARGRTAARIAEQILLAAQPLTTPADLPSPRAPQTTHPRTATRHSEEQAWPQPS